MWLFAWKKIVADHLESLCVPRSWQPVTVRAGVTCVATVIPNSIVFFERFICFVPKREWDGQRAVGTLFFESWDGNSFPRQARTGWVVWHLPIDVQQAPLGAQMPREWNLIWPPRQTLASAADVRVACASVLLLWEESRCKKWKTVWPCRVTQTQRRLWPGWDFHKCTCAESLNNNSQVVCLGHDHRLHEVVIGKDGM